MTEIFSELKEMANRYDEVSMQIMDAPSFEIYFAKIYGAVNHFVQDRAFQNNSLDVINLAYELLSRAVTHCTKTSSPITEKAANIFQITVQLLIDTLSSKHFVNQSVYEQAKETNIRIRAMKACGINLTSHYSSPIFSRFQQDATQDEEALHYAQENIVDFTNFVYKTAKSGEFVSDPFNEPGVANPFKLFERISALTSDLLLIPVEPRQK